MALRTTVAAGTQAGPWAYNDYLDLFTGIMNDQAVSIKYTPASGTTPAVTLQSQAGNPLLKGLTPAGAQAFIIDENGNLTATSITSASAGSLSISGALSWTNTLGAANKLMDLEQGYGVYSDNAGSEGGTTRLWIDSPNNGEVHIGGRSSGNVLAALRARAVKLMLDDNSGHILNIFPTYIESGSTFFGVKNSAGTKLFEGKATGDFVISGTTYWTDQASAGYSSGGSFDTFDFAEVFEHDNCYGPGVVVCPGPRGVLTSCAHDNCHAAMVRSAKGAFVAGAADPIAGVLPVAMSGRVRAYASGDIPERSLVCSDGRGSVRRAQPGEWVYALGYALHAAEGGMVGILLRPMYCQGV